MKKHRNSHNHITSPVTQFSRNLSLQKITYPRPITLRDLMSHTTGFEDLAIGGRTFVRNSNNVRPLEEYLEIKMPARVRPAGEFTAYSNYGSVLAAYVVEQTSRMPFDKYVEKNILLPLGMKDTTFNQPLPSVMASKICPMDMFIRKA